MVWMELSEKLESHKEQDDESWNKDQTNSVLWRHDWLHCCCAATIPLFVLPSTVFIKDTSGFVVAVLQNIQALIQLFVLLEVDAKSMNKSIVHYLNLAISLWLKWLENQS